MCGANDNNKSKNAGLTTQTGLHSDCFTYLRREDAIVWFGLCILVIIDVISENRMQK